LKTPVAEMPSKTGFRCLFKVRNILFQGSVPVGFGGTTDDPYYALQHEVQPFASEQSLKIIAFLTFLGKMLRANFDPGIFNSEATGNSVVFSDHNLCAYFMGKLKL
jgi:hypothetical protein